MSVTIAAQIVWQDVPGELAVFDPETDSYHALNDSAAAIWRELAACDDPEVVAARLAERYGAPRAQIGADVAMFVADALAKGLLVRTHQ